MLYNCAHPPSVTYCLTVLEAGLCSNVSNYRQFNEGIIYREVGKGLGSSCISRYPKPATMGSHYHPRPERGKECGGFKAWPQIFCYSFLEEIELNSPLLERGLDLETPFEGTECGGSEGCDSWDWKACASSLFSLSDRLFLGKPAAFW